MNSERLNYYTGQLLGVLLVLMSIAVINSTIDFRDLYSIKDTQGFVAEYTDYILNNNVPVPRATSLERQFKLDLLKKTKADCYVIGSSRVMPIDLETVTTLKDRCTSVINLWVPAAGYEDTVALLGSIFSHVDQASIFIEMRRLNMLKTTTPLWLYVEDEFEHALKLFNITDENKNAFFNKFILTFSRFSLNYMVFNLRSIYAPEFKTIAVARHKKENVLSSKDKILRKATKHEHAFYPSGRTLYPVNRLPAKWDSRMFNNYPVTLPAVDDEIYNAYRKIMMTLQQNGHTPVFLKIPFQNKVWECPNKKFCLSIQEVDLAINNLAKEFGIEVIGSFNPAELGMENDEFMDFRHISHDSINKVFAKTTQH